MSVDNITTGFERARLDYCIRLYEKEDDRAAKLERKAQFYLSFATVFLGAVFLKLDSLTVFTNLRHQYSGILGISFLSGIVILFLALLAALLSILETIRLRKYRGAYTGNPTDALFLSESEFLGHGDERAFIKECALSYAAAAEINKLINDRKAWWLSVTSFCILVSVLTLFGVISVIVAIQLF